MYRVYEVVDKDGLVTKEHGDFFTIVDAQYYAKKRYRLKPSSTFVINYRREDGSVCEQYYGKWSN